MSKALLTKSLTAFVLMLFMVSSSCGQGSGPELKIKLDGPYVFMDEEDFKDIGLVFHDCTFPFIRIKENDYWLYLSEPGAHDGKHSSVYRIRTDGLTVDKNTIEAVPVSGIPDANINELNGWRAWMFNLYEMNPKEWIAVTHSEDQDQVNRSQYLEDFRMGLAYSNDSARSFMYLGFILESELATSIIKSGVCTGNINIAGGGFRCDEKYMYVYFRDISKPDRSDAHGAVARARISKVVRNARKGNITLWNKYYDGDWNEPGLGGRSSHVGSVGDHSTFMYNTYLDQWISFNRKGRKLLMYRTSDPLDFNVPGEVVYEFPDDRRAYYYTIMPDQADMSVCGKEFYLYYSDVRIGIEHHLALFRISIE